MHDQSTSYLTAESGPSTCEGPDIAEQMHHDRGHRSARELSSKKSSHRTDRRRDLSGTRRSEGNVPTTDRSRIHLDLRGGFESHDSGYRTAKRAESSRLLHVKRLAACDVGSQNRVHMRRDAPCPGSTRHTRQLWSRCWRVRAPSTQSRCLHRALAGARRTRAEGRGIAVARFEWRMVGDPGAVRARIAPS